MRGQLTDAAAVRRAMLAGNARLTVVSARTGARFTFRFRRPKDEIDGGVRDERPLFVSLLTGPDNGSDFSFMATLWPTDGGLSAPATSRKSNIGTGAPSWPALVWLVRCVNNNCLRGIEVWHSMRCCRCGRALTVPSSIATGLGPECVELVNRVAQ